MPLENRKNKNRNDDVDLKTSTTNLFLNAVIFVLSAIVIYISFSIYVKIKGNSNSSNIDTNNDIASEIIQIEVLNGCGVNGVADRFTDYLRNKNFDVVNVGNYISFDIRESLIIDRIGNLANAKKVAQGLMAKESSAFSQLNNDYFVDVTIVIGRDYHKLAPLK